MPKRPDPILRALLVLGMSCPALAAARTTEVNVIVDFTAEGRKVAHPSIANPAYYLPVLGGFEELGAGIGGEKPPPKWDVAHVVAVELARQGYLEMDAFPYVDRSNEVTYRDGTVVRVPAHPAPGSPLRLNAPGDVPLLRSLLEDPGSPYFLSAARAGPADAREPGPSLGSQVLYSSDPVHGPILRGAPSLIVSIQYGYVTPMSVNFDAGSIDPTHNIVFNQRQMLGLVLGNNLASLDGDFDREEIIQRTRDDRYFIMVSAYDYESYRAGHRVVRLWQAKMSAPMVSLPEFSDALDALARAGGPFFGRETVRPATLTLPITADGHVEIGTPTIKDYSYVLPAATPPASR